MSDILQTVDWSRAQFALTAIYHWLFVPLTLGLGVIIAIMESIYYRTGDDFWKRTTRFWMRLFGVNFAIGVATGLILEFEFGSARSPPRANAALSRSRPPAASRSATSWSATGSSAIRPTSSSRG